MSVCSYRIVHIAFLFMCVKWWTCLLCWLCGENTTLHIESVGCLFPCIGQSVCLNQANRLFTSWWILLEYGVGKKSLAPSWEHYYLIYSNPSVFLSLSLEAMFEKTFGLACKGKRYCSWTTNCFCWRARFSLDRSRRNFIKLLKFSSSKHCAHRVKNWESWKTSIK